MSKNILLGVTAGAAVYKSCSLVRMFVKAGFKVKTVMTPNSVKLISPVLFESLSQDKAYTDMFSPDREYSLKHISLSKWADTVLIAPASANTIGKLANGICDNLLTTLILALPDSVPVFIAPAMNTNMWKSPLVRVNIDKLSSLPNYKVILPEKGMLASGDEGEGALASLENIFKEVTSVRGSRP